jgi:hypothetical protein
LDYLFNKQCGLMCKVLALTIEVSVENPIKMFPR